MAKRVKKNTNGRAVKGAEKSRKREISGLFLTALSIFVLVALITNIRAVWFGFPTGGITGRPGAWLSRVIFESIGITGFPAAVVLGIFSVSLFMHRPLRDALKPSILILVLGLFIPLAISIVGGVSSSASYGGIIGVFLASQMVTWLSRFGAFLAVLTIILVTVVLTTSLKISTMVEYLLSAGKWAGSAASGAVKQSKGNGKLSRKAKTASGASSRASFPLDEEPDYDDPFLTPPEAMDDEEYTEAAKPLHEPEIQYPERLRTPPADSKPELEEEPDGDSESPDWELDEEAEHLAEVARAAYVLPGPDLLDPVVDDPMPESREEMLEKAQRIVESLRHFNVEAEVKQITPGPIVTRYELTLAPGVKVGRIVSLADDLAMALKARGPHSHSRADTGQGGDWC